MKRLSLLLALLPFWAIAQTTDRSVTVLPPQVESSTYQKDGKTVTERLTTTRVREVDVTAPASSRKVALFLTNRAGPKLDGKITMLEDLMAARAASQGFQILSREVTVNAMTAFDPAAASTPRPADSLDTKLTNQTSALRLAQGMGADFLLVVTLDSLGTTERAMNAYGVAAVFTDTTMRLTYRIIDGQSGGTLAGDTTAVTASTRQTENMALKTDDMPNDLLDQAAERLSQSLRARTIPNLPAASSAPSLVNLTLGIEAADLYVPDVRLSDDLTITIGESKHKVHPLSVTVEIDGVAVGTAPGTIQVRSGFSKLRLTREGFKPWERTINASNGTTLNVALELSPEGYKRWAETTAMINGLKNGAKLTDAQVKVLEGQAKMLGQSSINFNVKEITNKSLF